MPIGPRSALAVVPVLAATMLAFAPPSDAIPGSGSAAAVVDELKAQGYDVQINWITGVSDRPLYECNVLAVHNPDRTGPPPTTFTTVYVDVSCPNHDDDFSIGGSVGFF
jgi:hypothetical protein